MVKTLPWILFLTWTTTTTRAQDTTTVTYSEEVVNIESQRFIDRYENVFMTKVPTKTMFKLGYTATTYKGMGLTASFEYKVLPFLSVEGAIYSRAAHEGDGIYLDKFFRQLSGQNVFISAGGRWYPNMKRRIARQQSANNFSGSYVSALYERSVGAIQYGRVRDHFSLTYGFQSRFLANGLLDFSMGLYYLRPFPDWYTGGWPVRSGFQTDNLVFASRSLIGLALGDWKKTGSGPLCDVLHCNYLVRQHFKIRLPEVNIGLQNQSVRAEIGYERKIGKSPFSVNLNIRNESERSTRYRRTDRVGRREIEAELRYYYLQKRQIRRGKASDNLSGLYFGTRLGHRWDYSNTTGNGEMYTQRIKIVGISAGYQQRLFRRLYFDSAISFSTVDFFKITKIRYPEVNAKAGVGFAL